MSAMNAFISYSHQDSHMLETLHKHLAQLQRDGIISAWTDREILAGGELDKTISASLAKSKLFLALLSPDYIASRYCYEKEFETALKMQEDGKLVLVPIILEPCDWLNTPFSKFKALPNDGRAVSLWENKNTAFLDVIQNLRKLIESADYSTEMGQEIKPSSASLSRNYRVQRDFDSIEKIEFTEKTFREIRDYLNRYMAELSLLDNIKTRVLNENGTLFECLLVNRNKIATEAKLKVSISSENQNAGYFQSNDGGISYSISNQGNRNREKGFELQFDEYHLFWIQSNSPYSGSRDRKEFESRDIAELMWKEWLETVGIM